MKDNQHGAATNPAQHHKAQQSKNLADAHKHLLTDTLLRGGCQAKAAWGADGQEYHAT